ncbi:MAG: hypothetical protein MR346_11305 [Clostridium sp.]|nr:hypothetical protein [Clostridium sp.]
MQVKSIVEENGYKITTYTNGTVVKEMIINQDNETPEEMSVSERISNIENYNLAIMEAIANLYENTLN